MHKVLLFIKNERFFLVAVTKELIAAIVAATKAKAEGKTVVAASVRAIRTRKLFDSKMWIYRDDDEDGALMNQNLTT